jgi:hypothetical protein
MNKVLLASAVAAAFSIATPFASAQSAEAVSKARETIAAASSSTTPQASGTSRAAPEGRAFRSASERVEARLAYMRTALKITDAQQSQWEGFANVLRKHSRDMDQRMQERRANAGQRMQERQAQGAQGGEQRPAVRNVSAIEQLERRQQRMTQRSARLNEVIAAAKPLYATFSPEQKQVADEMIARQGERGGKRGHHHRGMHRGV